MAPDGRKAERMEDNIMKYMNMKRYWRMDLQLFADAGDGGEGSGSEGDGENSDPEDDPEDGDAGDDDPEEEKKFSQKDVDDAVKKRLARERRKWQREQQKNAGGEPDGKGESGNDGGGDDKETQELRERAAKAEDLELKWTCLEHDVDKSCVDDVLALAKVHMARDEEMDIEDAIDKVLKKYPQFKEASSDEEGDGKSTKGKAWGQRHNGRRKNTSGVETAFLKRNPGLKVD